MISKEEIKILKRFGRLLNEEIEDGKIDPIIGRGDEIRRVTEILSRKKKNNPLLIGAAGVGKTAIVEGLALAIKKGEVPNSLQKSFIFDLNVSLLVSGAKMHGEFEERINKLLVIFKNNPEIIVFIDELHMIVGAGKTAGASDAANILKPTLARGEIRLIGATTSDEYREYIEKDNALERRFQVIKVDEPTASETIAILRGLKKSYENYHGISIRDEALVAATEFSMRFIPNRKLPDKAIDLIDEAAARRKIEIQSLPYELDAVRRKLLELTIERNALSTDDEKTNSINQKLTKIDQEIKQIDQAETKLTKKWLNEKQKIDELTRTNRKLVVAQKQLTDKIAEGDLKFAGELKYKKIPALQEKLTKLKLDNDNSKNKLLRNVIDRQAIGEIVTSWTKIPVSKILTSDRDRLSKIKPILQEKIKGQDKILTPVVNAIIRSHIGASDEEKPLASFIFLGPTGVGKTYLAKQLATFLFGSEKKMLRIDMSEYATEHSISRLIGTPPGYVGFNQGGLLTEWIKQNPYSIVLFDEFEKAHHQIQKLLLHLLDEGEVTDNFGRTHSFKNSIIIATSNYESRLLVSNKNEKANLEAIARVKKAAEHKFSSELYNRFQDVLVFNLLEEEALMKIIKIELAKQLQRLQKQIDIYFEPADMLASYVIKNVIKERLGARPIARFIEKKIISVIIEMYLQKKINEKHFYKIKIFDPWTEIELEKIKFL